jgi:hypothetical protein
MSDPNLAEQWAELCEEFRAVQARVLDAMKHAFGADRFISAQGADEINRAAEAEAEVRKRMDDFLRCQ